MLTNSHSTGGIIALGFGHLAWSVDRCIEQFKLLVPTAFSKRKGQEMKGIRRIQLLVKHSKYETTPLEAALVNSFGRAKLFDGEDSTARLRTAVTAVSSSGSRAWLLSNYNSLQGSGFKPDYHRYRPQSPEDEVLTWEA